MTQTHPHPAYGFGDTVPNGATIIAIRPARSGEAFVLCLKPNPADEYEPFVVWRMNPATGDCYSGDYFSDLAEAYARFNYRSGGSP